MDPEDHHYARLLTWAVDQTPKSLASPRRNRALCMMANMHSVARKVDEHPRKSEIVLLAATEVSFAQLFDTLVALTDVEDKELQLIAFGAASAALVLFMHLEESMVHMVNCCSMELIATGLSAHIMWSSARLKDQPLRCLFHGPLWVLNRCLMHWDNSQIDRFMDFARCNNIIGVALEAILEPVHAFPNSDGEVHSVSQMSRLREESLDLTLALCFEIFSRSEVHHNDFSESMVKYLLADVVLFDKLAQFVCKHGLIHSRSTALGISLLLWCCLLFGCGVTDETRTQLKVRVTMMTIRFDNEPILSHLWDTLDLGIAHEDLLIGLMITPHFLFKMVARDRLIP